MGKHGHRDRGYRDSRYRDSYGGRDDRDPLVDGDTRPRLPMGVVVVGLVLWSLLAWVGYALVDPVLGWIAANVGLLVDSGKGLAAATEAGKGAGSVIDNLNTSGFLGQAIALLRAVAKPAIVVVWALGALALIAAPMILPAVVRLIRERRH